MPKSEVPAKYIRSESDRVAIERGYYWDQSLADKFKEFYESCCVITEDCTGGKLGDKVKLIPYQLEEIILPFYSWRKPDGTRRFSHLICFIPKKNNKSGLVSSMTLFHSLIECPGATVKIIASKKDQAKIVYDFAYKTIKYGPLSNLLSKSKKKNTIKITPSSLKIEYTDQKGITSEIQAIPSNPDGLSGPSCSLVAYDELAEWTVGDARDIWERLQGATAARQGQHLIITTPQFNTEHIGFEKWSYAKRILSNDVIDLSVLPVLYGIDPESHCICGNCSGDRAGWKCPEQWWQSNPGVGITVPKSFFYEKFASVVQSPADEAGWKTLHCGMWIGNTRQWIASDRWSLCKTEKTINDFIGKECYVGIDLARTYDLAAVCYSFKEDGIIYCFPHGYVPIKTVQKKEKLDHVPYSDWQRKGFITFCDGRDLLLQEGESEDKKGWEIDFSTIVRDVIANSKLFKIKDVRFDPWQFKSEANELIRNKIRMVEFPQNLGTISGPTSYFEKMVLTKRLRHNNDCFSWCVGNCTIKTSPDGKYKVDKAKSTGRIDMAIAAIMSISGYLAEESAPTVYKSRGVITI